MTALAADELAAAEADERAALAELAELAALAPAPRQAAPRAMAEVRALAMLATCGQCWAAHREPCTLPPEAEPGSLHLARYDRAARRGVISGADMAAVLASAGPLLSPAAIVYPRDGADGACPVVPRNAEVNAGNRAPGGRDNPMAHAPEGAQQAAQQHREGDSGVSDHTGQRDEREGQADELASREDRRRELAAMSKAALCRMYRAGVRTPSGGVSRWVGGMYPPEQWEKNDVISSILDIEYRPPETAPGE